MSYGFQMVEKDYFVYIKQDNDKYVILSLYVDDILLAGNSKEYVLAVKKWLSSNFEMKDMVEVTYILEVKITKDHSKKLLTLSQKPCIRKIFERFNMADCKPMDTPISKGQTLSLDMCPKTLQELDRMKNVPYSSFIGSLMYVTRPDICYAVEFVSIYQFNIG
ncbi:hypothetical protein LWI28_012036 [Acer negundo]|uniref:Reverse transcriptase Ty1/copia-type domain-containing protein n=1 Tax=Acer negundo TaxID=4023 RepID=A0AAD5ITT8_ACENE|nr:hypothetical protein LWI28_012036 [Acer negundo]